MKKILGISTLLVVICVATSVMNPQFLTAYNLQNVIRWTGLFGVISIGAAFVIITGGIDLSIGSLIGLTGCVLPLLIMQHGWSAPAALLVVALLGLGVGLTHGLLITKLKLRPFVVTLCGLMIYRGLARWLTGDQTQGFGQEHETLRLLATGKVPLPFVTGFELPSPVLIMLALGVAAAVFLNKTVYGRYMLALGRNEQAARYSGINTDAMTILAYMICSTTAALGGVLFALDFNLIQPAGHGDFYELYAIAAAVLGGCSLRGGEGSIAGVIVGIAVMRVLYNSINLLGIDTQLEFTIIGVVILGGVTADELVKRWAASRRAAAEKA